MTRPLRGRGRVAPALALLCALAGDAAAQGAPEAGALFEVLELQVPGRALEVVPARLGLAAGGGRGRELVIVAVEGTPPDETRRLVVFAGGSRGRPVPTPAWTFEVPPEVAGFDVGRVEPGEGTEAVVLLTAEALRILRPGAGGQPPSEIRPLAPPAPLPARARGLSRIPVLADWNGDGRPVALVPGLGGARLVPLAGGPERLLALPLHAEYLMRGPGPPAQDEWLQAEITWPVLERADDDGDGRLDLFALSRFGTAVHRADAGGLATLPARELRLRPFSAAEELRHRATSLRMRAVDLDADGRADLFVHRNAGTLLNSRALTEIFWNRGATVPFGPEADVKRGEPGALVTCDPVDLDGDGRRELVETRVAFGIVQIARVLATRHIEVEARIATLSRDAPPRVSWTGSLSLGLDFAQARVIGLVPTVDGDWNADGRKDVLYGTGADAIEVRIGMAGPEGPAFGPVAGGQRVPAEGHAVVVDVDEDGLDDLVVHDPTDARGVVRVLRNLGALPGTPPSVRRAGPDPAAPAP